MSTLINSCRRIGRRCRVTWFRTLSWKVTPVWSQDTSVNFIDELFKFIDFLTFQVPDADACSSFLPSHTQGVYHGSSLVCRRLFLKVLPARKIRLWMPLPVGGSTQAVNDAIYSLSSLDEMLHALR